MAEELKRVGLVFTSEGAADLQKTLKNVATEAKNNQNEFKKLTSEYDENTSSVTKLTDKMKYAQAQAETYGDKCTLLKEKLENLQAAEAKNHEALEVKAGIVEGKVANVSELNEYAKIPSREGLLTMLAGGMIATVRDLSICLDLYSKEKEETK